MSATDATAMDLRERNRRVVLIIMAGVTLLIAASFAVGIRW